MKTNIFLMIGLLLITILSCKNGSAEVAVTSENIQNLNTERIISVMKSPESIPTDRLAKIAGTDAGKIEINKDYSEILPSNRSLLFSWPNGEIRKLTDVNGEAFELEAYSSLGLNGIKKMSGEEFSQRFESPDYDQKQIEKMAERSGIDEDIVLAEAQNLDEIKKTQKFEKVNGIGESAYWETPVNAMHVYADGTSFTVTTNLIDESKSKQKAVEFLNLILSN